MDCVIDTGKAIASHVREDFDTTAKVANHVLEVDVIADNAVAIINCADIITEVELSNLGDEAEIVKEASCKYSEVQLILESPLESQKTDSSESDSQLSMPIFCPCENNNCSNEIYGPCEGCNKALYDQCHPVGSHVCVNRYICILCSYTCIYFFKTMLPYV